MLPRYQFGGFAAESHWRLQGPLSSSVPHPSSRYLLLFLTHSIARVSCLRLDFDHTPDLPAWHIDYNARNFASEILQLCCNLDESPRVASAAVA